jgi:octaprenyl-diphosphate synthase
LDNWTGSGRARLLRADPSVAHEAITPLVAEQLRAVDATFRENLASPLRIVEEVGEFVADGGGKRIRPTLHLLCARLCGYGGPHDVLLATVIEFIHCATLIHDDIIDEATTRRGRASVNSEWDNSITVLFGDYMFAKAMEMALRADSLPVMERLADVTLRMTEGEMLQTRYVGRLDLDLAEYLGLIERKTAALFACSCHLAGLLAGVDEEKRTALSGYGRHLGMAFQLVDDLLDLTGDAHTLGKPAGSDLREGKATLAVLDLMGSGSAEARELGAAVMAGTDDGAFDRLTAMLEASGALERVRDRARFHARSAVTELERFEDGPARRALRSLPDLLLTRDC